MEETAVNTIDPDSIMYMEAPSPFFRNIVVWESVTLTNAWTASDDRTMYGGRYLELRRRSCML